jgi:adenylate cyclase
MANPQAKRRLAAILAVGIVGYGRLADPDEEETPAPFRQLRQRVIDPAIGAHRGHIVKATGDGLLVVFSSAVDAVRCALAIQRAVDAPETDTPHARRIVFRIGINVGDVVVDADGGLMGGGANIATRLESISEPGGISLSRAAYDQVRGKLDLAVRDQGPQRLRDIAEPVQVFAIDRADSAQSMQQYGSRVLKAALAAVAAIAAFVASAFWLAQE